MLRSYFEAFSIRNIMVQLEFNLDTGFANYNILKVTEPLII